MRMNYTMMGDTVNLAARLESSAKQYGIYIQIGENTYNGVKDRVECRFLDYVQVKGKNVPVRVYELLSEKGKLDEAHQQILPAFHEAQEHYFKQNWEAAIKGFLASQEMEVMYPGRLTNPSAVYIERCKFLKDNPPGKDWDGVWRLVAK